MTVGRPDNRTYVYRGDKRGMVDGAQLMGPDVHGVYWQPLREYYEPEPDETLVVFKPIHPDDVAAVNK
jgi:hypothetical protein